MIILKAKSTISKMKRITKANKKSTRAVSNEASGIRIRGKYIFRMIGALLSRLSLLFVMPDENSPQRIRPEKA